MKKLLFIIWLIAMIVFLFFAVSKNRQKTKNDSEKIRVVATLFPLYDFTKNIGQDKAEVSLLLPPGVESHTFEPRPADIARINEADIFIYTGKFMEPWIEDVLKGISNKNIKIIDSSLGLKTISAVSLDKDESAGAIDPHVWLDFDNDKAIVQAIADAFSEKDRLNQEFYRQKAAEYKNKLSSLDAAYKSSLLNCASMEIIYGGHYAFGYLASRYNLRYSAAQGVSPDAEPTAKDLIRLIEQIKKDNIKYVFYEELAAPKIAQAIAGETEAKMLVLNAAHNLTKEDFENNVLFLSIMEENLANLKIGLQCNNK